MTEVQFYHTGRSFESALHYTSRLIQKAANRQHSLLIHVESQEQAEALSLQLWSLEPQGFIAHGIGSDPHQQINIDWQDEPGKHHDVLVNLSTRVLGWHGRFEKLLEIIYEDEQVISQKRQNYLFYKKRGYPLKYHDLTK